MRYILRKWRNIFSMKNNKKDKNKKKNLNPNDPRYMTPEQE